jgi:hypothetical protein
VIFRPAALLTFAIDAASRICSSLDYFFEKDKKVIGRMVSLFPFETAHRIFKKYGVIWGEEMPTRAFILWHDRRALTKRRNTDNVSIFTYKIDQGSLFHRNINAYKVDRVKEPHWTIIKTSNWFSNLKLVVAFNNGLVWATFNAPKEYIQRTLVTFLYFISKLH